ncbi:hypothetical protein HHI36_002711 [Cryptolaemus montrouzieri]|uniref:UDP-glucuronosyltransferase n=1 Tax=Cryptolaemus montrouzieri TaxID=559131 RepID=A0ABD2PB92_9CUCU
MRHELKPHKTTKQPTVNEISERLAHEIIKIWPKTSLPTHKFKAPLISVSSVPMYMSTHYFIGNPIHPFLYPEVTSGLAIPVTTFRDKLDSLYIFLVIYFLQEFYMISRYDAIAKKHFGEDMPDLREMIKKTSFFFDYGNPFLSFRRPLAANHKEVWNIRTLETALPKDLQHIIDNAKNGVVYFSLGTTVSLAHLENEIKNTMLEVLSELPYTVLCKWDEEFDGKSDNLLVRKMFPQRSILAHPNVKLFITHAGIQSAEEALLNGVPMVVIPITYDQPFNSKQLKKYGVAEIVHLSTLTKDSMKEAIYKVAEEKEYRAKAKEISKILLDQPRSGLDEIMWWCEYVIRHKGAAHLRSPAADISLYDYFMLDVLVVVLICSWLIYKMIIISLRMIIRFLKKKILRKRRRKIE